MNIKLFSLALTAILFLSINTLSQTTKGVRTQTTSPSAAQIIRSTPAYAEVLLRKTDLEANLEDLLVSYTDDFPKVKETRYELDLVNASLNKILAVNASDTSKLTLALGKLLVRKAELETDLWSLKSKFGDEHPEVKRTARKVEVFDKAVKEILP